MVGKWMRGDMPELQNLIEDMNGGRQPSIVLGSSHRRKAISSAPVPPLSFFKNPETRPQLDVPARMVRRRSRWPHTSARRSFFCSASTSNRRMAVACAFSLRRILPRRGAAGGRNPITRGVGTASVPAGRLRENARMGFCTEEASTGGDCSLPGRRTLRSAAQNAVARMGWSGSSQHMPAPENDMPRNHKPGAPPPLRLSVILTLIPEAGYWDCMRPLSRKGFGLWRPSSRSRPQHSPWLQATSGRRGCSVSHRIPVAGRHKLQAST
ncbi:unnamed protein product [Amoebophrya sp. A120]|nr:unnamed protein product [Amoebophrya sp. A120]|eukprot:GSA120T00017533001.1